jgi:hypothetical protein
VNAPGFLRSAVIGLLLSAAGAVAFVVLAPLLGTLATAHGVIVGLALACLLLTLHDSAARVGRVVSFSAWLVLVAALYLFDPPVTIWLLAQVGALWLVRCLYRYDALRFAAGDALLTLFALACAMAAWSHAHSVFLALWTFFLVQALTALMPGPAAEVPGEPADDARFDQAFCTAEAALRRMS